MTKWIGQSKSGVVIFTVVAKDEEEAKREGFKLLESDSTFRPLLKLWLKDGSIITPK